MELEPAPWWRRSPASLFLLGEEHVSQDYVGWLNNPDVNRYLESRYVAHSLDNTRAFVATARARADTLFLGIRDDRLERHVGNIKLGPIDTRHGRGEVGLMIGDRAAWGHGVGSAAITALAEIARRQLGLRMLTAGCYASNIGSRRAFEKAGFEVQAQRSAFFILNGHLEDLVLLGLTF